MQKQNDKQEIAKFCVNTGARPLIIQSIGNIRHTPVGQHDDEKLKRFEDMADKTLFDVKVVGKFKNPLSPNGSPKNQEFYFDAIEKLGEHCFFGNKKLLRLHEAVARDRHRL